MFQFIDRWKLELKHHMDIRRLRKQRDIELRNIKQEKQFEINKTDLEREAELEELKAEIRKNQQKSLPKPGQVQEKKTAFAAFQDYATNFAQNQQKSSSGFGNMSGGLVSPYDQPEQRRHKKKHKNKKKRNMNKRKEVRMVYVPMNQFGNRY